MFLVVRKVTINVPNFTVIGTYLVTCLTARNRNNFKFSDAQYAKIVYNYKRTKEKLYKTNASICYYIICKISQLVQLLEYKW